MATLPLLPRGHFPIPPPSARISSLTQRIPFSSNCSRRIILRQCAPQHHFPCHHHHQLQQHPQPLSCTPNALFGHQVATTTTPSYMCAGGEAWWRGWTRRGEHQQRRMVATRSGNGGGERDVNGIMARKLARRLYGALLRTGRDLERKVHPSKLPRRDLHLALLQGKWHNLPVSLPSPFLALKYC